MTRSGATLLPCIVIWSAICAGTRAVPGTSYISRAGNDVTGDGSSGRPWKTYQRARGAAIAIARKMPSRDTLPSPQSAPNTNNYHFGPGIHSVGEGLHLGEADGGAIFSGEGRGVTVLTGGTVLSAWTVGQ